MTSHMKNSAVIRSIMMSSRFYRTRSSASMIRIINNAASTKNAFYRHNSMYYRYFSTKPTSSSATNNSNKKSKNMVFFNAGVPLILFSILSVWVVGNAIQGRLKEYEVSQQRGTMSLRQAAVEEEQADMMERIDKIVQSDFDNTKRIKRPEEILEERRLIREKRNRWYRRFWRWMTRQE
jgi:hypothetical protein